MSGPTGGRAMMHRRRMILGAAAALTATACFQTPAQLAGESGEKESIEIPLAEEQRAPASAEEEAGSGGGFGGIADADTVNLAPVEEQVVDAGPVVTETVDPGEVITGETGSAPTEQVTAVAVDSETLISGISITGWAITPLTWCVRGDGGDCRDVHWSDPRRYKQVLVLPTGYTSDDYDLFRESFDKLVERASNTPGNPYSERYRDRIMYIGYWLPGGELGRADSKFGGKVFTHPVRGTALTLRQNQVIAAVNDYRRSRNPKLRPWAVMVVFNTPDDEVTPNASPPSLLGRRYGIAKLTRGDLEGNYTAVHELGHASLNFLDEYIEAGFENVNINLMDYLTPLALLDGSWGGWVDSISNLFGIYQYKVSETLAANGYDNISVTRYPSRVRTPGYSPNEYEYEGGMFFGKGTYHDRGNNVMNSSRIKRGWDDGFDYTHSRSQEGVVRLAFEDGARPSRPNDRIRNAGPARDWKPEFGSSTKVMLFDADKEHHYQPTRFYQVQVTWKDRYWTTCKKWGIPYPCRKEEWKTAQKTVYPRRRTLSLEASALYGLASIVQDGACFIGLTEISTGDQTFNLCDLTVEEMAQAFLPSLVFPMPYQAVNVPAEQWMTKYFWRFRTYNGRHYSGWTGWSDFYRAL